VRAAEHERVDGGETTQRAPRGLVDARAGQLASLHQRREGLSHALSDV